MNLTQSGRIGSHDRLFSGNVWFVDAAQANDAGGGLSPDTAKATIGAAITAAAAGDAITVKAGTYTETGLNLNKAGLELWAEIGVILDPATGTCLTVSGNYCKVFCDGGALFVTPAANETGLLVSGTNCYISDVRVNCASTALIGFDVTGNGCQLTRCRCADPLTVAFKVQGDKVRLLDCCCGGKAADTSYGYWLTNTCDKARLDNCCSEGNASGSFVIDSDVTAAVVRNCSSGGADGRWIDTGHVSAITGFAFDDVADELETMDSGTTHNLFVVTGTVRVDDLYGVVRTQIENVASTVHLEAYSTGGTADITDAPGTNVADAVVGSTLARVGDSTVAIALASAATPAIIESADWRTPDVPVYVIADADQTTYIRTVYSAGLASGVIRWHCHWAPVSDNGWLAPA